MNTNIFSSLLEKKTINLSIYENLEKKSILVVFIEKFNKIIYPYSFFLIKNSRREYKK